MAESDPPSCRSEAAGLSSGGSNQVALKEGGHSKKNEWNLTGYLRLATACDVVDVIDTPRWYLSRVVSVAHILRRFYNCKMVQ